MIGGIADPTEKKHSRIVALLSNLDSPAGLASSISNIPIEEHPVDDGKNPENQSDNDRTQLIYTPVTS